MSDNKIFKRMKTTFNNEDRPKPSVDFNNNPTRERGKSAFLDGYVNETKNYDDIATIRDEEMKQPKEEEEEQENIENLNKLAVNYQPTLKDQLRSIMNQRLLRFKYAIITFYILFADDIKMIAAPKESDVVFSIIAIILMFVFTLEIGVNMYISDDYFMSLYFFIDLVGMLSMALDIHWVINSVIANLSSGTFYKEASTNKGIGITRLSRGVRIITRAVRILRHTRLLKLFKGLKKKNVNDNYEEEIKNEESKVGQKLEELTLKRVIILVFLMIIAITFFNPNFYYNEMTIMDFGIQIFNDFPQKDSKFNFTFDIYVEEQLNSSSPIIYTKVYDRMYGDCEETKNFRSIELVIVRDFCYKNSTVTNINNINMKNVLSNWTDDSICDDIIKNQDTCVAIFNNKANIHFSYIMNMVKTIFISIVLSGGMYCFTKDTNDLVVEPIEKMTRNIKDLSKNPIAAMQNHENEDIVENVKDKGCFRKKKEAPLETAILEKTISKIGALLALGFGEAGAEIISKNMQNGTDGDVNPMIPGKKVMAIYGFCDIRNFTDTTEVLQERVMIFVNQIAEIVHEITSDYCGSANKNIGDAFLLVWKIDEKFVKRHDGELKLIKCNEVSQLVDMALIAFLKILAEVHKSFKLNKYREDPALNERIKNYSVKMGFGLHLGYSIEGAIGSMFKIDASYLSPNVNMSSKLEEKTKEYGVQLVISDEFTEYLSEHAKLYLRIIDQVKSDSKENPILSIYLFINYS